VAFLFISLTWLDLRSRPEGAGAVSSLHQTDDRHTIMRIILLTLSLLTLAACKHLLTVEGGGDVIERLQGQRGCSLEELNAGAATCTDNEVAASESVIYQGLPRPGWVFSHWTGACTGSGDCELEYREDWAELWDTNYPEVTVPPLSAVFVAEAKANPATAYTTSSFGLSGNDTFSAYLDTLFFTAGSYRHTTQQAGTRSDFNRIPGVYARQGDGILATGPDTANYDVGGAATATMDIITLVDNDASDGDVSVSYLTSKLSDASPALLRGTYYCGHIGTGGTASFFRAILNGNGGGVMQLESDRLGRTGQAALAYSVNPDGSASLDYSNVRLVGSVTADGGVFLATQLQASARGAAACVRASARQTVLSASGTYNGALFSGAGAVGVTQLLAVNSGQSAEAVLLDSYGNRSYSLGTNWLLVNDDGKARTQDTDGAISGDGRVMFRIKTDPQQYGSLVVYLKQTN